MLPIIRKTYIALAFSVGLYGLSLILLTNPWLQRQVLYAHSVHTTWWHDINQPEQFGFAKNQVTPFTITTADNEKLYAWHVLPLGLYAKHESDLVSRRSGLTQDVTKTKAFSLLRDDPNAYLIINFHGNAGHVAQGWRTDSYRAFSDGSPSNIHILTVDYRGFGYSSGSPTEEGLIMDGIATVEWAMSAAKVPSSRIVILGHSLGTAVTSAVVETFASRGVSFAGVVLVSAFTDLPTLLTSYSIGGWVPILSPLSQTPALQRWFSGYVVDRWPSATRLANFVRLSDRVRLFIIHAKDDFEIPWAHSDELFATAANATTGSGMNTSLIRKMKRRGTVDMGHGAFISTWKSGDDKMIREEIVAFGGHNRIITYAPVSLAIWKAFGLENTKTGIL